MDIATIGELISTYGFPILCCIYMMTTMNKTLKEHTEKTAEMMSAMKESLTSNTDAINQLTLFINSFVKPTGVDDDE